jgi:cytochrome c-type biogenesis protein CcmH/NrfF
MTAALSIVTSLLLWGVPLVLLGLAVVMYVARVNEDAERQARVRQHEEADRRLRVIRSEAVEKMLWIALSSHWDGDA